jgi:hypothetical protein
MFRSALVPVGLLSVLSCLAFSGCSKGPSLVQVKGTVNVDGQPTEGVRMLFHPTDTNNKIVSSAVSKAGGEYTVVSDMKDGIPVGSYTVTATYPDPSHKVSESDRMQGLGEPGKDMLVGKYASKDKGLKVEVSSSATTLPALEFKTK